MKLPRQWDFPDCNSKNNKAEYSDAIEQIMDKLLYGDNFKNSLINNTIYHLLNFEKHKTFQAALREAAVSNDFQVVLLSRILTRFFLSKPGSVQPLPMQSVSEKERDVEKPASILLSM